MKNREDVLVLLKALKNRVELLNQLEEKPGPIKSKGLDVFIKSMDAENVLRPLLADRTSLEENISMVIAGRKMWRDTHPDVEALQINDEELEIKYKSEMIRDFLEKNIIAISNRLGVPAEVPVMKQDPQRYILNALEIKVLQRKDELRHVSEETKRYGMDLKKIRKTDVHGKADIKFIKEQIKNHSESEKKLLSEIRRIEKQIMKIKNKELSPPISKKVSLVGMFGKRRSLADYFDKLMNKTKDQNNIFKSGRRNNRK